MTSTDKHVSKLSEWQPSKPCINLIKLNGITDEEIAKSLDYLKNQNQLTDVSDLEGYDNWNSFFIVFCIKANTNTLKH